MTLAEYRQVWKAHIFFDMWPPLPSVSEVCQCGHRIRRWINATITCAHCQHEVKSYERIRSNSRG